MEIDKRIKSFVILGIFLKQFSKNVSNQNNKMLNDLFYKDFDELIKNIHIYNPWFVEENVRNAINAIADNLKEDELLEWFYSYIREIPNNNKVNKVAVIMAGNVPLVGFHDMLCVLLSGNKFIGKLSSDDKYLLPLVTKVLITIEPEFADLIEFTDGQLNNMEAIIATGSNNTARYFEYYFGKYPNIIRKNRNSVAVLLGTETAHELRLLGDDIFQYFGLGCRNVSKLFVPDGYIFDTFYQSIFDFNKVINHNKYANNYDYNRTVYLMASHPSLLDNNFLLLKEDKSYSSPIGVLFFEYYDDLEVLNNRLEKDKEQIQCIVSGSTFINNAIPFGQAQCPALADYADNIDTLEFLISL